MNNVNIATLKYILTSNRMKSLYWRTGMMFLAGLISILIDSLSSFQLPGTVTIFLGLVLGEISKLVNQKLSEVDTI